MKIAHLSDTHIGHTRYARVGAKGINQREIDVFATLRQALKAIEDRDPDLVLHTGDFFDKLRPSNQSLYHSFQLLAKFQERRGYRPFVIVAGNHETPRMAESFSPLMLLGMIQGVKVFVDRAVAHPFDELDLEILAIPDNGLHAEQKLDWVPTLGRKHRVLAVHGLESTVNQISDFDIRDTKPELWTYVGLGDYHVHKPYAPNACYSGSTDFTSTNIWEEVGRPKGWVWFDTEVGELEFCPLTTREVIDLPKIEAKGLTAVEIDHLVGQRAKRNLSEAITRQVIGDVHPLQMAEINQRQLRDIRERCFHYEFDARRLRELDPILGTNVSRQGVTIEQSWSNFLADRDMPPGLKREAIEGLGIELITEVREREATSTEA